MTINERLTALRTWMRGENIDAYIIPSSDPHQSEYVADHWKSREWISGFTGSAGTVVVTADHAGLWTDSRYFLQGEQELSLSEFILHKMDNQVSNPHQEWLKANLQKGQTVALDGKLFSQSQCNSLKKALEIKGLQLRIDLDAMPEIWQSRPSLPQNPIFVHDTIYAGKSRIEKLDMIRSKMKDHEADYHLSTALDDIAWTLNIRGTDVSYNPVAICYLVVGKEKAYLFLDQNKIPGAVDAELKNDGVESLSYDNIIGWLNNIDESDTVLVDPSVCSAYLYRAINGQIVNSGSPARYIKSIKNETEIKNFKNALIKDGAALTHAFKWLEDTVVSRNVPEAEFADKLAECRSKQEGYKGESFPAIIGYKGNGAIIHYHPTHEACHDIKNDGMLLADSGGQYINGTTDITRTICFSEPTEAQKMHYTCVLKGMISLSRATFPRGTQGCQLDTFARQYLWAEGLNYLHGTGHGVGFFMNVHEPPQGFAPASSERGRTAHEPGMLSSNEPGYYLEGSHGIRIENLMVCIENGANLGFETVTLFPIATNLIDKARMTTEEIAWLNAYHQETLEKVGPLLDEEHKEWLKEKCQSI